MGKGGTANVDADIVSGIQLVRAELDAETQLISQEKEVKVMARQIIFNQRLESMFWINNIANG